MVEIKNLKSIPSNTPIKAIPSDYYPDGCGNWFEIVEGLDAGKKMISEIADMERVNQKTR